jgi:hypothetical protein
MRKIPSKEAQRIIDLYKNFLAYCCNRSILGKLKITLNEIKDIPIESMVRYREKVFKNRKKAIRLINQFCKDNPFNFSKDDINLIYSWRNYIKDNFFIIRHDKDFTIFGDGNNIYAVKSLKNDLNRLVKGALPKSVDTVLLPYKDYITYDGMCLFIDITFGKEFLIDMKKEFSELEKEKGIIYSLDNKN